MSPAALWLLKGKALQRRVPVRRRGHTVVGRVGLSVMVDPTWMRSEPEGTPFRSLVAMSPAASWRLQGKAPQRGVPVYRRGFEEAHRNPYRVGDGGCCLAGAVRMRTSIKNAPIPSF